jgi:hypothetical protein
MPSTGTLQKKLATPSKQKRILCSCPKIALVGEGRKNLDVGVLLPVSSFNIGIWQTKKIENEPNDTFRPRL